MATPTSRRVLPRVSMAAKSRQASRNSWRANQGREPAGSVTARRPAVADQGEEDVFERAFAAEAGAQALLLAPVSYQPLGDE